MQRGLFLCGRERPGRARAAFGAEHKAQLLRWPRPSGLFGRNIAHGSGSGSAQSRLQPKKQSSQLGFRAALRATAMCPFPLDDDREDQIRSLAGAQARFPQMAKKTIFAPQKPCKSAYLLCGLRKLTASLNGGAARRRGNRPGAPRGLQFEPMRILITGISGALGATLADALASTQHDLHG